MFIINSHGLENIYNVYNSIHSHAHSYAAAVCVYVMCVSPNNVTKVIRYLHAYFILSKELHKLLRINGYFHANRLRDHHFITFQKKNETM